MENIAPSRWLRTGKTIDKSKLKNMIPFHFDVFRLINKLYIKHTTKLSWLVLVQPLNVAHYIPLINILPGEKKPTNQTKKTADTDLLFALTFATRELAFTRLIRDYDATRPDRRRYTQIINLKHHINCTQISRCWLISHNFYVVFMLLIWFGAQNSINHSRQSIVARAACNRAFYAHIGLMGLFAPFELALRMV